MDYPSTLVSILRDQSESTSIPRHVLQIEVGEDDVQEFAEDDDAIDEWRADFPVFLNHFDSVSELKITFLNMARLWHAPEEVLRPDMVVSKLILQDLVIWRISDILSFVLKPSLKFLALGRFEILENEHTAVPKPIIPADSRPLSRLEHLLIFGECGALLRAVMESVTLDSLKTLVTVWWDHEITSRLIKASSRSLHSLALVIANERKYCKIIYRIQRLTGHVAAIFDLSCLDSLENLSIDISSYPRVKCGLPNLVQTVTSIPRLQHLFINCSREIVESDNIPEGGVSPWVALDSHFSQLPCLEYIAFTLVLTPAVPIFWRIDTESDVVRKWKDDVFRYAAAKLPSCHEKKLIQVKEVVGSWVTQAFAGAAESM